MPTFQLVDFGIHMLIKMDVRKMEVRRNVSMQRTRLGYSKLRLSLSVLFSRLYLGQINAGNQCQLKYFIERPT